MESELVLYPVKVWTFVGSWTQIKGVEGWEPKTIGAGEERARGGSSKRVEATQNEYRKRTLLADYTYMYMYLHTLKQQIELFLFVGGMVKQGNSLEDFKKIAERNGITVCQEGNLQTYSALRNIFKF